MRSGKRGWWILILAAAAMLLAPAFADTDGAVRDVLKTMTGPNGVTNPRITTTPEGYLRFLGAPLGNSFQPSSAAKKAGSQEATAKTFLSDHRSAFGIDANASFTRDRVQSLNALTTIRLNQLYKGIPVFGAQVTIQLKPDGGVTTVSSDVMRDAPRVYSGGLSLAPTLNAAEAKLAAAAILGEDNPGRSFDTSEPVLSIFMPYVIGATGQARLVYIVEVTSLGTGMPVDEQVLVDAHNGSAAYRISMIHDSKFRIIIDGESIPANFGSIARFENDGPSGIQDVDDVYDYLGDTYDFYFNHHDRDSFDDQGGILEAVVRHCPDFYSCPMVNAFWRGGERRMYFGDLYTADDVVSHELTHGVTQLTSGLIYANESGALNESFSDVWGEFIDLENGRGTDTAETRWLHGEDLPNGHNRNMKDPNERFDPDTYQGDFWMFDPFIDNGGVHINSGVSNKLSYLLTDGDTFKGYVIDPMGIDTVADLYYTCQTQLLNMGSDYLDFGLAMLTAADILGLSSDERDNIAKGLFATEIIKLEIEPLRHFRATGRSGDGRVALTWRGPSDGDFTGVDIVRNTTRFPNNSTDGTVIASITDTDVERFVDTPGVGAGTDVYYGIFARPGSFPVNLPKYARATVGVDVDFFSQSFTDGTDLAYSQLTFVPTGPVPISGPAVQKPEDFFNYTTYAAHASSDSKIAPNFDGTLPVEKVDFFELPMADDGTVQFTSQIPIPFFGRLVSNFILSSNGFLSEVTQQYLPDSLGATTSLESHFAMPRISFLYSDLNPKSGGEVWARFMDDRIAVTFEDVPSFDSSDVGQPGQNFTNTVQCELFYGGQIRFTYLDLTAERAIVGISDGNGVPLDVDDVLANSGQLDPKETNLNELPEQAAIELQPIPIQYVEPGTLVQFTAVATSTQGAPTYSKIAAPFDLGLGAMDGTLNATTGEFEWNTDGLSDGAYGMILCASAGDASSCQIVAAILTSATENPVASNLTLAPNAPRDSDNLVASYTYSQSANLIEGPTVIYWLKNNAIVPAYTNFLVLPDAVTKVGDSWSFQVLPATVPVGSYGDQLIYLYGDVKRSKVVTIQPDLKVDTNGDGKVNSVDLQLVVGGLLGTPGTGIDPDVNGDGSEDAADVQTTINYILEKR
ncbi:MAG: M4 family metallopeptidase [Candidatus Hydrogenedentes bacterium]|nr:M4 family metallopeptidase [Candidatus Hydrogenedentota bacterium]